MKKLRMLVAIVGVAVLWISDPAMLEPALDNSQQAQAVAGAPRV